MKSTQSMTAREIDVIIPTTASVTRQAQLLRALESVLAQTEVKARPLVVANGPCCDEELLNTLKDRSNLTLIRQHEGSLPLALLNGRKHVNAPYFSVLDDDDEYLPGSLRKRLSAIENPTPVSLVVSNGYIFSDNSKTLFHPNITTAEEAPLDSLLTANWLASCGGTFRTADVPQEFFDLAFKYFEWTAIAFRTLVADLPIRFINDPTFIIHDTENSLSKSSDSLTIAPDFIASLTQHDISTQTRRKLLRKIARLNHDAAKHFAREGAAQEAAKFHLRSLKGLYGILRHLSFTPRLCQIYWRSK